VVNWAYEQLYGGVSVGTAVYRFSGQGRDQHQTFPWKMILKILLPTESNADPAAWNYYKREAKVYQSGWLDNLSDSLVAPHCFGVFNHPEGTCWIWLEELQDTFDSHWPLDYYRTVARHLGRFAGAYLTGIPLPSWPWLSVDWIRCYVEQSTPSIEPLREAVKTSWGRRWLPEKDCQQFFYIWEERAFFLEALNRLPQTICHYDIFHRNMFVRQTASGDDQSVVIDWAFVGSGPIGADMHPLVWMSIDLCGVSLDQLSKLEKNAFDGYLEGLREVGWQGDPRLVRLGYLVANMRYLFPELHRWLALILDESLHPPIEKAFGKSVGEAFDGLAQMRTIRFDQLDEARKLIEILE